MLKRSALLLCALLVLGVTDPLLAASAQPLVAPAAAALTDTAAYRCDSTNRQDWYKAHPTQSGQSCIPAAGWGKITRKAVGGHDVIIPFDTPYFTSAAAASQAYICTTELLLRTPVMRSMYSNIPGRFSSGDQVETSGCRTPSSWVDVEIPFADGIDEACWVLDQANVIRGYKDRPCEHRNRWAIGPLGGFSICNLVICQTEGHRTQAGYEGFLAHKETWSYVGWSPARENTVFVPCGTPCNQEEQVCEPNDLTCTQTDPVCEPNDLTCTQTDPVCEPNDLTCAPPPICTNATCAPPPPRFCDMTPSDPRCRVGGGIDLDGVRIEVVLDVPDVYASKGTLRPQGARVRKISLLCGTRLCASGADNIYPSIVSVTGRLVLGSTSRNYSQCSSARSSNCAYYVTTADTTAKLQIDDQVLAAFFTPTRPGQQILVKIEDPNAVVRIYAWVPAYEWARVECTVERTSQCRDYGYYYVWTPSTLTERVPVNDVTIPVVVLDSKGAVLPAAGLTRQVIGSIGN